MNTAIKELVRVLYDTEKGIRNIQNDLAEKKEAYTRFEEEFQLRVIKVSFDEGINYGKTKTKYLAEIESFEKSLKDAQIGALKLEKEILKHNLPLNKDIELQLENEIVYFRISSDVITGNYRNISFHG